jgi:hypothetical protein
MSMCGSESGATVMTDDKDLIGRVVRGKTAITYASKDKMSTNLSRISNLAFNTFCLFPNLSGI